MSAREPDGPATGPDDLPAIAAARDGASVGQLSPARWIAIGVLSAVAIGIAVLLLSGLWQGDDEGDDGPFVALPSGAEAPPSSVRLVDYGYETFAGEATDLATFAGRPIVLNFFASWCGPCVAEMPDLQAASEDLGGSVQFVGLAVRDRTEDAERIVAETGVTYPVGHDRELLIEVFRGIGMPSTVFIDAAGNVLDTHVGVLTADLLRDKLVEHGFA